MNFLSLLFSVRGRINRVQYWIGSLAVYGASWAALLFGGFLSVLSMGPNAGKEGALGALLAILLLAVPIFGTAFWCYTALQIKRFHDRGKSWLFVLLPFALSAAFVALSVGAAPNPILSLAVLGVSVWYFIELGCLPSKAGPNQYGDQPGGGLGGSNPAPQAPMSPMRPGAAAAPQPSLGSAELAMERAIAAQQRASAPAVAAAVMPPRAAPVAAAPSGAAPAASPSFGRRVSR